MPFSRIIAKEAGVTRGKRGRSQSTRIDWRLSTYYSTLLTASLLLVNPVAKSHLITLILFFLHSLTDIYLLLILVYKHRCFVIFFMPTAYNCMQIHHRCIYRSTCATATASISHSYSHATLENCNSIPFVLFCQGCLKDTELGY